MKSMKRLIPFATFLLPAMMHQSDAVRMEKPRAPIDDGAFHVDGNSAAVTQDEISTRIVGGSVVGSPTKYPWMVQGYDGCGGSLIASDIVLTAAHCDGYFDKGLLVGAVQGGSTAGGAVWRNQTMQVKHPSYDASKSIWDFMVIKLDSPVTTKQPIELNRDSDNPTTESVLTVIGFGATSENGVGATNLMGVPLDYIDYDTCNSVFRNIDDAAQLCAGFMQGGRDVCYGDNGGPLMDENNKLVGVLSFGIGCARRGIPGVYSRVSGAIRWIEYQVCSLSSNPPSFCWAEAASSPTSSPTPSVSSAKQVLVVIEVDHDLYPEETSWTLQDSQGNVVALQTGGSVSRASEVVSKELYLEPGSYNFTITDSYGDGMCCEYGSGSYRIMVNGSTVVADDGDFETSETKNFTVTALDNIDSEVSTGKFDEKRNAVSIEIDFQYDMHPDETTWYIREQDSSNEIFRKTGVDQPNANLTQVIENLQDSTNYELVIMDSHGDGFCCGEYGDGRVQIFAVVDGKSFLLQEVSGEFQSQKVVVFSVPESLVLPASSNVVELAGVVEQSIEDVEQAQFPNAIEGKHVFKKDCEDTEGTFFVDRVLGDQNCAWLAMAADRYKHLCEFVDVVIACPKTCNSCSLFS